MRQATSNTGSLWAYVSLHKGAAYICKYICKYNYMYIIPPLQVTQVHFGPCEQASSAASAALYKGAPDHCLDAQQTRLHMVVLPVKIDWCMSVHYRAFHALPHATKHESWRGLQFTIFICPSLHKPPSWTSCSVWTSVWRASGTWGGTPWLACHCRAGATPTESMHATPPGGPSV